MKVEVAVLGSPSIIVLMVSSGRKATLEEEFKSCVRVEVAVLGSPSIIVLMVSMDAKQH